MNVFDSTNTSNNVDAGSSSGAASTSTLRMRFSNRARSTITRVLDLREPPPKRNDTPLNFTEPIADGAPPTLFRRPQTVQEPRHTRPSPVSGVQAWFSRLRGGNGGGGGSSSEGEHSHRPQPGKPVNVPHEHSSRRNSKDKGSNGHRLSIGGHRRVLGNLIPNGLGTILNGVGGGRHERRTGIDIMMVFPMELIAHIFSYLDHRSLLRCQQVSRPWYSAATELQVWRHAFEREYGRWEGHPYGRDWRAMFEAKSILGRRWLKGQINATYLKGHTDSVYCVQFDRWKIVTGSRDQTVRVWDIASGECIKVIGRTGTREGEEEGVGYHRGSVLCLQFDESILVTGSSDHTCIIYDDTTICVWDRAAGVLLNRLRGHEGPVNAVQLRGKLVASVSGDARVKLWEVESGACRATDGRWGLAGGGNDHTIRVWDVGTGQLRYEIEEAHKSLVRSLDLDDENGRIISGSYDQSVRVWDLATGRSLLNFPRWHASWVLAARGGRRIVSSGQDAQVLVLDFAGGLAAVDSLY
ncbi:hypothetical protein DRE_01384 [Drechslerella stenobrocha 248]|uniref:F-box domain-containing protein n=1 Tax=Drechslerella stenobrocha 248 TaxID=1043628 RepID=W7HVG1_9PEZI|nr:hypothetical protein DRE_01384 [Drechslerella stenobrocha 248]